jgi:bacterioferritin (cytochrome b1)
MLAHAIIVCHEIGCEMDEDLSEAKRYRKRAEEIRTKAPSFTDEQTREMFVGIAADYERMADTLDRIQQTRTAIRKVSNSN